MKSVDEMQLEWVSEFCWQGIECGYDVQEVVWLCGFFQVEYMLVCCGVECFWEVFKKDELVRVFGVLMGNQVVQQVKVGFQVIYFSGW